MRAPQILFRHPLVCFAVAGALVFAAYALLAEPERQHILVSQRTINNLIAEREQILDRKLLKNEREALITSFVESEILVREAVARGLHIDDGRVRTRLTAKMNFLLEEEPPAPTTADLERVRAENPDRYLTPETVTFEHVFFKTDQAAAEALLPSLKSGQASPETSGEKFWLGHRMERYSAPQLLTLLGVGFINQLGKLREGEWSGPIKSGRGWHLVKLVGFHKPEPLADHVLKERLEQDWAQQHRQRTRTIQLKKLRERYNVEVLLPEDDK